MFRESVLSRAMVKYGLNQNREHLGEGKRIRKMKCLV